MTNPKKVGLIYGGFTCALLATVFASWKVGGNGGADGLLNSEDLAQLAAQYLAE